MKPTFYLLPLYDRDETVFFSLFDSMLIYLNLCFLFPSSKPPLHYNQAPQTNSYLRPEGSVASNKNIPEVKSIQ